MLEKALLRQEIAKASFTETRHKRRNPEVAQASADLKGKLLKVFKETPDDAEAATPGPRALTFRQLFNRDPEQPHEDILALLLDARLEGKKCFSVEELSIMYSIPENQMLDIVHFKLGHDLAIQFNNMLSVSTRVTKRGIICVVSIKDSFHV